MSDDNGCKNLWHHRARCVIANHGLPEDTPWCGVMGDMNRPPHPDCDCTRSMWWGCLQPERAHDENELWDLGCPKCQLRMRMVLATEGADILCVNAPRDDDWIHRTLGEIIGRIDSHFGGVFPPVDYDAWPGCGPRPVTGSPCQTEVES